MQNFTTYEVGQKYEQFKNYMEDCRFDIDDNGAKVIICFNGVQEDEVAQFKAGHPLEFRFISLSDVIMVCAKIGNLNWIDMPYNVNLSPNLTTLQSVDNGMGLSVQVMLFDSLTGELKALRLVGLSTKFTKDLFKEIKEQKEKPFNAIMYDQHIKEINYRYSTNQLVKLSRSYCKIN